MWRAFLHWLIHGDGPAKRRPPPRDPYLEAREELIRQIGIMESRPVNPRDWTSQRAVLALALRHVLGELDADPDHARRQDEEPAAILPPWRAFPKLEAQSMAWRMGQPGRYCDAFDDWFDDLNKRERVAYRAEHPEPEGWEGFYERGR